MFGSPTVYLLWAILSCIFLIYLILHLWSYDRFKCLQWRGGQQSGTFRRIMTYSYLGTVPLLLIFSVAITVIKFKEGFVAIPGGTIVPKPFLLWGSKHQQWILPLYFVLSAAWGLELVTHLEELAFWLFLLHQGPSKRDWFHSWEYRAWCIGSIVATAGMPLTTLLSRRQIETCMAWIFLIGASAGTSTTLSFLYVITRVPSFLLHVKSEGAEPAVVIRLTTFYRLNCIRVIFRFLFTLPLLILASDGISAPYPVVGNRFALDFLLMVSAIGCFASSAITLLIFFPHSITREVGSSHAFRIPTSAPPNYYSEPHISSPRKIVQSMPETRMDSFHFPDTSDLNSLRSSRYHSNSPFSQRNSADHYGDMSPGYEADAERIEMPSFPIPSKLPGSASMVPSLNNMMWDYEFEPGSSLRRRHSDSYFHSRRWKFSAHATAWFQEESRSHLSTSLHPYVLNFTSPIDLVDGHNEHGD